MIKLTKEEFIRRSELVHGDKYDYSLFEYINNKNVSQIKCKEHGIFKKSAYIHINKKDYN